MTEMSQQKKKTSTWSLRRHWFGKTYIIVLWCSCTFMLTVMAIQARKKRSKPKRVDKFKKKDMVQNYTNPST